MVVGDYSTPFRPLISFDGGELKYSVNNISQGLIVSKAFFSISKATIKVGCSDITPEALDFVYDTYHKHFPRNKQEEQEITIQ